MKLKKKKGSIPLVKNPIKKKKFKNKKGLIRLVKKQLLCKYFIRQQNYYSNRFTLTFHKRKLKAVVRYHLKRFLFVKRLQRKRRGKLKMKRVLSNKYYMSTLIAYKNKVDFLIRFFLRNKKRQWVFKVRNRRTYKKKYKKIARSYGIIKINTQFSNLNFLLSTLTGKVIRWTSGGSDLLGTRGTRMTSRSVHVLMKKFIKKIIKARRRKRNRLPIQYIKVQFTGPSRRFRAKFHNMIRRKRRAMRISILCREDAFQRSYNGCRLSRRKRK
jgi:hypothetical protein